MTTSPSNDWRIFPAAELEQGSLDWHVFRRSHYPASEAGAVTETARFFPKTRRELFAVRSGEAVVEETMPMRRGTKLEPIARQRACELYGMEFEPAVAERGKLSASLDGVCFDTPTTCCILELKCPMNPEKLIAAVEGELDDIPEDYVFQMAQQAYCVPVATDVIFGVYDEKNDELHTIAINGDALRDIFLEKVAPAWEEFEGSNYEPLEIDQTENETWCTLAKAWSESKDALKKAEAEAGIKELQKAEKAAKTALIEACEAGIANVGHGIRVGWSEVAPKTVKGYVGKRVTGMWED